MTTEKSASEDALLDDVFASDRDRGGKSAPPGDEQIPEAKSAPEPQSQADKPAQPETQQAEEVDEAQLHPVPRGILKKERERFRAKIEEETRARVAAETEARLFREQMAALEQQRRQAPPPQPQQPRQQVPMPDPILEPERFAQVQQMQFAQALYIERLNASEGRARDKFGDELVDQALQAAQKAGLANNGYFEQQNARHPYGALIEWFKKEQVVQKIGADPAAYEKQIEERVRQQVLAELKAGNRPGMPAPAAGGNVTRFPGTLADATASGQQGANLTDEAVMNSVFSTNRKRK